jgi:hypothetical protein
VFKSLIRVLIGILSERAYCESNNNLLLGDEERAGAVQRSVIFKK